MEIPVIRGSLREIQAVLDKRKLATGRDAVGRGLMHKAVLYNHKSVIEWLGKKYPETLHIKDNVNHSYIPLCSFTRTYASFLKPLLPFTILLHALFNPHFSLPRQFLLLFIRKVYDDPCVFRNQEQLYTMQLPPRNRTSFMHN